MAKKATCMMLTKRLVDNDLEFVNIDTKEIKELRTKFLNQIDSKTLIVSGNEQINLAIRNVEGINYVDVNKLNAKHLVNTKKVLLDESSVKMLEERLTNGK